jgi:hypothetical protein
MLTTPITQDQYLWVIRSLCKHFADAASPYTFKIATENKQKPDGTALTNYAELHWAGPSPKQSSASSRSLKLTVMLSLNVQLTGGNVYALESMIAHFLPAFTNICVKKHGSNTPDEVAMTLSRAIAEIEVIRLGSVKNSELHKALLVAHYSAEF